MPARAWLIAVQSMAVATTSPCSQSDARVQEQRNKVCFGYGVEKPSCCGAACTPSLSLATHRIGAPGQDWPSQAVDMVTLLTLLRDLGSNETCANTSTVRSAAQWLNTMQAAIDPAAAEGGFTWNYRVFQVRACPARH